MPKRLSLFMALATAVALTVAAPAAANDGTCHATGAGSLTANYVNQVPSGAFDVTCDIGVYLDADTTVEHLEVAGTTADARPTQYGVYVDGAHVVVRDSTVTTEADYPGQFVAVAYLDGATGAVDGNDISGAHRVGVLLRGDGTDVTVKDNTVVGTGPKSTGWAENGIQADQGATGTITRNTVSDHWWDPNSFVSAGVILVGTNDVTVQHNTVRNNDLGVALYGGDRNNAVGNTIEVTRAEAATAIDTLHYGVWVAGENNGVRQNTIAAHDGEVGIYVFPGSQRTKLIRNSIDGWSAPVFDGGSDTKRPAPFTE